MNLILTALLFRAPHFKRDYDQSKGDERLLGLGISAEELGTFGLGQRSLGPEISIRLS